MSKRINVILPEETARVLERVTSKGNRSRLISDAVMHYVSFRGKSNLAEQLKAGAIANTHRDSEIAQEWFALEDDPWPQNQKALAKPKK